MEQHVLKKKDCTTRRYRITLNGVQLSLAEIRCKLKSSPSFRAKLQECIRVEKSLLCGAEPDHEKSKTNVETPKSAAFDNVQEIIEKPIWVPSRNRNQQNEHDLKSAAITTAARSSLFSITCGTHPFSNIDSLSSRHTINAEIFKHVFFNQKHLPGYKRLDPLPKLLLAQYELRNAADAALKTYPYPFTFRLPTNLHAHNIPSLNKKIKRKLTSEMKRPIQFWMAYENDGKSYDQTITHCHGEISINPNEFKKIKQTFIKIFKSVKAPALQAEPRILSRDEKILKISALLALKSITAHIRPTDGAKVKNAMPFKAIIDLHTSARNSNAHKHGKFYSIFNWVSYATKQELDRKRHRFDCQIHGKLLPGKQKFFYISKELHQLSSVFYNENIRKVKV